MRVLITGAAGFIGSNLYAGCVNAGWHVSGVDDLSNGHLDFLLDTRRIWQGDFTDRYVLDRIGHQCYDAVIHLAALPRVSYSVEHPVETNDVNVSKTLRLIDACRRNVKRFVFASSSAVYGGAICLPTPESTPKQPMSPYALQKSIIEDYLALYDGLYGNLDAVSLRFFNVFGPNQLGDSPYSTAISAWITAIKRKLPMRSDGDGSQSRDMCYVSNVVDACMKAALASQPLHSETFNIACGERTTNKDILQYLLKRYTSATYKDAPWRPGDVLHTQADISSAKEGLGYEPTIRIWEGIDRTCDWYDANWDWIKNMRN